MTIKLTDEQAKAYARFIRARDKVKLVRTSNNFRNAYIPHRDYLEAVNIEGMNHPLFVTNDDWLEYKEASAAWWAIEPPFRNEERLRASRGDYGDEDSWDEEAEILEEIDVLINGG